MHLKRAHMIHNQFVMSQFMCKLLRPYKLDPTCGGREREKEEREIDKQIDREREK